MRITKQQANENKARIVETAAALFRQKGFDGVGVADLMRNAGLTHGGFYNHFESKDDLEAAACAHVFDQSVAAMEAIAGIAEPAERARAFDAYRRRYVSKKGRDATAARCPMVAFAGDVSRQSPPVREAPSRAPLQVTRPGAGGKGRRASRPSRNLRPWRARSLWPGASPRPIRPCPMKFSRPPSRRSMRRSGEPSTAFASGARTNAPHLP